METTCYYGEIVILTSVENSDLKEIFNTVNLSKHKDQVSIFGTDSSNQQKGYLSMVKITNADDDLLKLLKKHDFKDNIVSIMTISNERVFDNVNDTKLFFDEVDFYFDFIADKNHYKTKNEQVYGKMINKNSDFYYKITYDDKTINSKIIYEEFVINGNLNIYEKIRISSIDEIEYSSLTFLYLKSVYFPMTECDSVKNRKMFKEITRKREACCI